MFIVIYVFCLRCPCCVVVAVFYIDVVIFLFIRWSCKQVYCFDFVVFFIIYFITITIFVTIHTYKIGHWKPSVRFIDLVSHTTYVVCVNFIPKCQDLQFKVDSERQFFWENFHGICIYSHSFCKKSAKRNSSKKYFLYFVLMSGLGLETWLYV